MSNCYSIDFGSPVYESLSLKSLSFVSRIWDTMDYGSRPRPRPGDISLCNCQQPLQTETFDSTCLFSIYHSTVKSTLKRRFTQNHASNTLEFGGWGSKPRMTQSLKVIPEDYTL